MRCAGGSALARRSISPNQTLTPTVTIEGEDQEIIAAVGEAVLTLFD
ncbi:hypothetical protein [Nocardia xishanensis]